MKQGYITIVGRPNAGKSTLINHLLGKKLAIVSRKAQTTRNVILGLYKDDDSNILFIDTPGIHSPINLLGRYMNREAVSNLESCDVLYYLYDASKRFTTEDEAIIKHFNKLECPIFLVLSKIDLISKDELILKINELQTKFNFTEIIPISVINNDNIAKLLKLSKAYLYESEYQLSDDFFKISNSFQISELIREILIDKFHDEIPYQLTVICEEIRYTEKRIYASVSIIVGSKTHKAMIIGKGASSLREINYRASKSISNELGRRCELSIFVKVDEKWFNKEAKLNSYGYKHLND